jgi:hypothetical protein
MISWQKRPQGLHNPLDFHMNQALRPEQFGKAKYFQQRGFMREKNIKQITQYFGLTDIIRQDRFE